MNDQQNSLSYGKDDIIEDYYSSADYYDLYGDEINVLNQYDQSNVNMDIHGKPWSDMTFHQLCTNFILPAVWGTFNLFGTTLIFCIVFRLFVVINNKFKAVPESILHIVCAICGILPLVLYHKDGNLYELCQQIILFPIFCYIVSIICILLLKRHSSIVFSVIILLTLLYRECFLDNSKWRNTKSAHMIMSMKAMAVLFDIQSNEIHKFPSVAQYTGYMMCAGTLYLGPFLSFQEYSNTILLPVHWNITKVCHIIWKIIITFIFYVLSLCVLDWLLTQTVYTNENRNLPINIFLTMYVQALEFRIGHYFIAYATTVFAIICGYHRQYNSEIVVTRPMTIELPKSLLHVVVHWNTPMHYWLKKYIFEQVLKYGNKNKKYRTRIIAVGTTYIISSLLHGLERRLSAVLLSLAAYTYVEHLMRTKLASKFPRSFYYYSKIDNSHQGSKKYLNSSIKNTWLSWSINITFTILNIFHLAYLGSIMDMSVSNSGDTINKDVFAPWRRVSYFSHFIMLLMYLISILL